MPLLIEPLLVPVPVDLIEDLLDPLLALAVPVDLLDPLLACCWWPGALPLPVPPQSDRGPFPAPLLPAPCSGSKGAMGVCCCASRWGTPHKLRPQNRKLCRGAEQNQRN